MKTLKMLAVSILLTGLFALDTAHAQLPLTLERPSSVDAQQSAQSPCVIGDNSCNNPAGFAKTLTPSTATWEEDSPT